MSSAIRRRGAAQRKLPLWDTICLSYSTYFDYFGDVLRIVWLWLAAVAPLTGVANWLQWSWVAGFIADQGGGLTPQTLTQASGPIAAILLGQVDGLVLMLAGLSIAVAWHRRIILGEPPGFCGSNIATKSLWRYLGVWLAICLIAFVPMLAIVLALHLLFFAAGGIAARSNSGFMTLLPVIFLIDLAAIVVTSAVMLRLSLLLPARAAGDLGLTFKETWQRTRGNTWRMSWGIAACVLPPLLITQIGFWGLVGFPGPQMFASEAFAGFITVISIILAVNYLLILPIVIGFLSLSYRHFLARVVRLVHPPGGNAR